MDSNADAPLSAAEIRDLSDVAGTMIPADAALGVPGADDPVILDDIVRSVGRDLPRVREALINDYYMSGAAAAVALGRLIVGAYYRDDRVLLSLKLEARAPFPKGY